MDEAIKIEISGRIDGKIVRSIRDIAQAALDADNSLDLLRQSLREISNVSALRAAVNDTREFRNEINRATQTQRQFAATNEQVGASLLGIARDADRAAASIKRIEGANVRVTNSLNTLRSTIGPLVGMFASIFAVQYYAQAQDALTGIQNKIRSLTGDYERQRAIQEALFDVADRTRTGVEATTDGFVRFSKAMTDASDEEVLRFVETLNKSLISAGRSVGEVNSVVVQLGQALTSGRLQGDEFRALSENLPREALEEIARVMGVTVMELKALSAAGKITTDVLRTAFANLAKSVDEQFARTVPTIGQALTVLRNDFIAFTEDTQGAAGLLAEAIMMIGDNLNIIIPIIAAFAAAWAAVQLASIVGSVLELTTAFIRFLPIIAAHTISIIAAAVPWIALAAAIALVVGAIAMATGKWDDLVNFIDGALAPIKDMAAKFGLLGESIEEGAAPADAMIEAFTGIKTSTTSAAGGMDDLTKATNDNKKAVKDWSASTVDAVQEVISSYNQLSAAKKAALSEGSAQAYKDLVAAGGSSGSFQALPAYGEPGNNAGSITTLGKMAASQSSANENTTSRRSSVAPQQVANINNNLFQFNVQTPNADSFRRSRGQMAADVAASLG